MNQTMRHIIAKQVDKQIIIPNTKDIGKLYDKSKIGRKKNNILYLDPLEAVFLLEKKKIKIVSENKEITFKEFFQKISEEKHSFETQYLIYRDLRNRGYPISIIDQHTFSLNKKYLIFTFSEDDIITVSKLEKLCRQTIEEKTSILIGVVDEEGDITYYEISTIEPIGEISNNYSIKTEGILFNNGVIIFNQKVMDLHKKEFYGKPFEEGLQLSLIEALYLKQQNLLKIITPIGKQISYETFQKFLLDTHPDILFRYPIYQDLKKRQLIVKTGFKFGTHFRAYTNLPNETHAEYLIHVIKPKATLAWAEISRGVRLAHAVRKTFLFAFKKRNKIIYLKITRIRP